MKYIFQISAQNQKIKDTILAQTDIVVKVNLHSSSSSNSEMWVIYDDKTNQISYYNNISKDRNHPYRVISINNRNSHSHDIFISLLSRIRGFVSLKMDGVPKMINITGYKSFLKNDTFNALFDGNNFEKPLVVGMPACIDKDDYSSLITGSVNKEYNLGILSIELGDSDPHRITGYKYKPYNIPDNESLLGCKIANFIKGIDSLDIKNNLSHWFKTNGFDNAIDSSYAGNEVRMKEYAGLEWALHFVIIRHGLKTTVVKLDDFLSSIDVNDRIMWNIIGNMTDLTEGEATEEGLSSNEDDSIFPACINLANELLCLSNILDMKPLKFNLCNGQSI